MACGSRPVPFGAKRRSAQNGVRSSFFRKLDLTPFFFAEKLAELYVATGESVQVAVGKSAFLGPPPGRANPILPVIGATVCSDRPAFWAPDSGRSWKAGEKVTSQNLS